MPVVLPSFLRNTPISNLKKQKISGSHSKSLSAIVALLLFLALLVACPGASAQTATGSISGTVVDSQGLPVEGASVTLTNQNTNYMYTSVTGSSGGYQFSTIDFGVYSVTASKDGFRQGIVENIKLDASTTYSVHPIRLEVGVKTESITVEGGAEIVNTVSAEQTGTVEKKQIDELPILDRNPLALLSLQAGVANSGPMGAAETTINGQRSTFSTMTLDGINIQDNFIRENALDFSPNLPFNSQASEFTITQQNGDVEKSGSSGVSIVTPKGGNAWHGEGFWYYRTNAWAANDWFNNASGAPLPNLLQNQGGGNIGGPIIKDKLFIYGYYELLRLRQQSPNNTTTLSPAIQSALTGASPTLPFTYQPTDDTGAPAGNPITVDLLTVENGNPFRVGAGAPLPPATSFTTDPTMLALIQRVPTITNNNRLGDGVNLLGYQFNARSNRTRDNTGARVDYNINSRNTLSGIFSYNRDILDRPDIDTSFNTVPLVANNDAIKFLSTSWRWNPSNSVTNEVRFGFNLAPAFFTSGQSFSANGIIDSDFLPFTNPDPNFLPQGRNTRTWVWQDNLSWVRGNHTMKFGFQFTRVTIFSTGSAGIYPDLQVGFSDANGATPDPTDFAAPAGASISQADFSNAVALIASASGILDNISQTFNVKSQTSGYVPLQPQDRNYRQNNFAIYAADSWRMTPKLTFNYGVRWDLFSPVNERDGLVLLPVIPSGQTATQTLLGDATVDFAGGPSLRGLYNTYWKGFSPNLGLAWDPFGNGKTAIRAGFSMNFVNDSFFTAADNAAAGNAGLSTTLTADSVGLAGPTVSNPVTIAPPPFGIPTTFSQNANIVFVGNNAGYSIDPHLRPPYVEQWNLSIQRDLGWNTSLTVAYVGNHGVGLFRAIDVNQLYFDKNGFLDDFNRARQNGFLSQAAGQGFDPLYSGPGGQPLTVFPLLFASGGIDSHDPFNSLFFQPGFVNLIKQGQIGTLIADYHGQEWDTGFNPGPSFNNPVNFFTNPFIMGGDLLTNASFSTYHAAVVEVRRRLTNGFYMQANYVFSKVMTDYGPSVNNDQSRFQPFLDNARIRLERARAPFDFNHQFKANFTYELPIGRGHRFLSTDSRALGLLLNGWQTGSIFTWQSGAPYSIISGQATFNRSGLRSSRNTAVATLTHQQISSDTGLFKQPDGTVYVINPILVSPNGTGAPPANGLSCVPAVTGGFCNPQPGEVGNLQLYAFTGPSYFDWDMSASKDFDITERFRLTFRAEAFNLLNHPVFGPPFDSTGIAETNINSFQFGQSTSTVSAPRILQLSLRLKF
jgi:hypothetical protein